MKSIRELISSTRKLIKENLADARPTNKFIFSLITKHSNWLIRRESNNLRLIKFQSIYQTLKCVEIIEAPAIDPCCGIKTLCTVWRSKYKLPPLYEDTDGAIIKSISSIDNSLEFILTTPESLSRKLRNPWTKLSPQNYAYYNDGYIYFTNRILLAKVTGFFTGNISTLNCGEEAECIRFLDTPFPIPQYLEAEMIANVLKELVSIYKQIPEDININKSNA